MSIPALFTTLSILQSVLTGTVLAAIPTECFFLFDPQLDYCTVVVEE